MGSSLLVTCDSGKHRDVDESGRCGHTIHFRSTHFRKQFRSGCQRFHGQTNPISNFNQHAVLQISQRIPCTNWLESVPARLKWKFLFPAGINLALKKDYQPRKLRSRRCVLKMTISSIGFLIILGFQCSAVKTVADPAFDRR